MSAKANDDVKLTRSAADVRADGGTRDVRITAARITIERQIKGMRMNLTVPVDGYRGLVLAVRLQAATASLRLAHADPELDVLLTAGDAVSVAQEARAWAAFFSKKIAIEETGVLIGAAYQRQRRRQKPSRRSQFARRRRTGVAARMSDCFAGEREIIART